MTLSQKFYTHRQRGFTLIEMAIVLLIAGLLVAGISQMMSSAQKNRGDQAVANEVRTVTNALERMLVDQQAALATAITNPNGGTCPLANLTINTLPTASVCNGNPQQGNVATTGTAFLQANYLPAGLNVSGYLNNVATATSYTIGIARNDVNGRPSFRALIIRQPDNPMDDGRLSRVASLIGTQGGMVSNTTTTGIATGVLGSWNTLSTAYGISIANAPAGSIAALTNTVDAQISVNTLSRIDPAGPGQQSEGNTMRTDLYMGGSTTSGGDTWAVHNASGYGYVLTNAYATETCGPGSAALALTDTSGNALTGQTSSFTPDVYSTVVGFDSTKTNRVLLQCVPTAAGATTYNWQPVGTTNTSTAQCHTLASLNLPGEQGSGTVCWMQLGGMTIEWGNQTGFGRGEYEPFPMPFKQLCSVTGHFDTNGGPQNGGFFEGKYLTAQCNLTNFQLDLQDLDGYSHPEIPVDWIAVGM